MPSASKKVSDTETHTEMHEHISDLGQDAEETRLCRFRISSFGWFARKGLLVTSRAQHFRAGDTGATNPVALSSHTEGKRSTRRS